MSKSFEMLCGLSGLDDFAKKILEFQNSGAIILQGDLASGKTTLTKAFAKALGKSESVSSPTFTLCQDYGDFYHYDLYRVNFDEIMINGLFENFLEDGVHIAEWGDERLIKALKKYGIPTCVIIITPCTPCGDERRYEVSFA